MGEDVIEVQVENVLMSNQGPVVLLSPKGDAGERVLPIFIDQTQALNIQLALEGQLSPRPMTHDLFSQVLNELGAIVERVVIEELAQNTFYASLYVEVEHADGPPESKRFDARPSDCLALAVRAGATIQVREALLASAAIARSEISAANDDEDLGIEP